VDKQTKLFLKFISTQIILDTYVETEAISRLLIKHGIFSEVELSDLRKEIISNDTSACTMQKEIDGITKELDKYCNE